MTTHKYIQEVQCQTWQDFADALRDRYPGYASPKVLYRGQSKVDHALSSTWERRLAIIRDEWGSAKPFSRYDNNIKQAIDDRLKRFQHYAIGLPGISTDKLEPDDWLALARHHGLMSPLLDWTYSPYIACFFAFSSAMEKANPGWFQAHQLKEPLKKPDQAVVVWALRWDPKNNTDEFRIIVSRGDTAIRQRAQQGVFSELTHETHIDLAEYVQNSLQKSILDKYILHPSMAAKAIYDLNLMGINHAALHPDLDGAATQAGWDAIYSELKVLL